MAALKDWIAAARLRTLPLSISGVLMGAFLSFSAGFGNYWIAAGTLLCTLCFQVLSNFANDYGDGIKGTDAQRIGEQRAVASGKISAVQMKKATILFGILSFLFSLGLVLYAFGWENLHWISLFLIFAGISIWAAIKYTVGKNAYGYSGFGDLAVLMFFGLLSVLGSYFLYHQALSWQLLLPALSVGFLSSAVLNLNNLRDFENDQKAGKITLPIRMGKRNAEIYHGFLLFMPFAFGLMFFWLKGFRAAHLLFLLVLLVLIPHYIKVIKNKNSVDLDPELKKVALSTLLFVVLFGIGLFF